MSGRVELAVKLIREGELSIAAQILEKDVQNIQALYLSSLIYRYNDAYDKEKLIVDKALALDQSNQYMQERFAWHGLPLFDKMVTRQPLHLPRDPKKKPSQATLE